MKYKFEIGDKVRVIGNPGKNFTISDRRPGGFGSEKPLYHNGPCLLWQEDVLELVSPIFKPKTKTKTPKACKHQWLFESLSPWEQMQSKLSKTWKVVCVKCLAVEYR